MDAVIDAGAPLLLIARRSRTRSACRRSRPGEAGPVWRQVSFAAGVSCCSVSDLPPLGERRRGDRRRAHGPAPADRRPRRRCCIALGLTGPILQPMLARRPFSWLRVLGNPLVALPLWALNLYLWHLSVALRRGPRQPAAAPRPARLLLHLRAGDVAAAGRPAAEAGLVRRRGEAASTSSSCASSRRCSPTS